MIKQKSTRCNRIASLGYTLIKTKGLIKAKEYKTRHEWVGKVINRELFKKFKFEYIESDQVNETNEFLWDFEIQTDHLISPR